MVKLFCGCKGTTFFGKRPTISCTIGLFLTPNHDMCCKICVTLRSKPTTMLKLDKVHHIAIICSDYRCSLEFYTRVLGLNVLSENYRAETQSYKTDLALGDHYVIELFSFPSPPQRPSHPEAAGLRHLAFAVQSIDDAVHQLDALGVAHEEIRTDGYTGKRFLFFYDPDHQPLELYEQN